MTENFRLDQIDNYFPKEKYRDGQKEAIEFILDSYNNGKKIVILECPTGGGKSAIGMTVADMVNKSYYLTVTKILQQQLVDDFGDGIIELKGRNAYPCTWWDRHGSKMVSRKLMSKTELEELKSSRGDCSNGYCKSRYNPNENKHRCEGCFTKENRGSLINLGFGKKHSDCPYYEQVHLAIESRKVVMNFSSFLFQTQMTNRFDDPRDLMIIDECHNLEPQLLNFVSMRITDFNLQDHGLIIPKFDSALEYAVWFEESKIYNVIHEVIKEAYNNENSKLADDMSRLLKKYKMFMEQITNNENSDWVVEYETKSTAGKTFRTATLKPVFASDFIQPLLFRFSKRILMMSATILDVGVVAKSLGINREHIAAYKMQNRFPVKNRKIFLQTVGKMTGGKNNMHNWAPQLVKKVDQIMLKYPDHKGIIHTHNYAIMDFILNHSSKATQERLLDQRDFDNDKAKLLEFHAEKEKSVIIAPAMHEGIDLKDDLSRFQIICKVPFANCFDDRQLARRVELDRRYYDWLTALRLVQSYGRSIRSETDWADTYVLDESIFGFLRNAKSLIPNWFTEAIVK